MVEALTPPKNAFVRNARKVYNPVGFQKGYNFILWFIFAGAFLGFILARFMYFNINGVFCATGNKGSNAALPGECFYYTRINRYKVGIRLHLYGILPAGFLVLFQFTPFIRHKVRLFHRINGYIILLLATVGNIGAIMICKEAFGGTLATQTLVGFWVLLTTLGLSLAYYNIKRLQIDQHRAWMLRTWFWFGSIVTLRLIMVIMATIISKVDAYYFAQPCDKLGFIFGNDDATLLHFYPSCASFTNGSDPSAHAIVRANTSGTGVEVATAFNMSFGAAGYIAFAIHAIGIEIYLRLTPREAQRLREVSYQRQLEAGMKNPGNCGITPQRIGDANEWKPLSSARSPSESTMVGDDNVNTVKVESS